MARNHRGMILSILLVAGGLLIILGVWLGYTGSGQPTGQEEPVQVTVDPLEEIPRVSLADARAAYETGAAVFVDVRDAQAYAERHIPGAKSIPLNELPDRLQELKPEDWIITYCT